MQGKVRNAMKAITQDRYGSAAVLEPRDIDMPEIGDDEVLVCVEAASIHVGDWILMTGVPYVMRMATGLRKPKIRVPGTDIAGTVKAVGKDVKGLGAGNEVFGWCKGAFAEYVSAPEDHFVRKPANITFEQAAAVGVSATTALQLLRDDGKVQPGQKVLINGASGGVGTFAVQIAKAFGAEVTGVCGTRNVDMVRSIGADHVIDYTREDFTQGGQHYDLIVDNVGTHSLLAYKRVLNPNGIYVMIGSTTPGNWFGWLATPLQALVLSPFMSQNAGMMLADLRKEDLATLAELMRSAKVTPD